MRTLALTTLAIVTFLSVRAQVVLPEVPHEKRMLVEVSGTYKPSPFFLKANPDFQKTGIYSFDINYYVPNASSPDRLSFSGYYRFNSNEYPVTQEDSKRDFSDVKTHFIVQYTTLTESYSWFYLNERKGMVRFRSKTSALSWTKRDDINAYATANRKYLDRMDLILKSRNCKSFTLCDIGTMEIDSDPKSSDDLILQFILVQNNIWIKKDVIERAPSHSLYKLVVKNAYGDTLKIYSQGIFYNGNRGAYDPDPGYIQQFENFTQDITHPIAVNNLLNRFLNDDALYQQIHGKSDVVRSSDDKFSKTAFYLIKTKAAKDQTRFDLNLISSNLRSMGVTIDDLNKVSPYWQAANQSALVAIYNLFYQRNNLNRVKSLLNEHSSLFSQVLHKEDYAALSAPKPGEIPADFQPIVDKIARLDAENKKQIDFIATVFTALGEHYNRTASNIASNSVSSVTTSLNNELAALNQKNQGVSTTPPSGSSNTSSNPTTTTPANPLVNIEEKQKQCAKQSQEEWEESEECKECKSQTIIDTSQASCARAKAKLIEITLKNCSAYMPVAEVESLKKTRAELLNRANELDRGATGIRK